MSYGDVDVEAVVRAVMARLAAGTAGATQPAPAARAGELTLLGQLVTELDLAEQLTSEKTVRVAAGTVLTPSARDYLNDRGIKLQRIDPTATSQAGPGTAMLVLGLAETKFEPSGTIAQLKRDGIKVDQVARVGLTEVVENLTDRVRRGGDRALLLTGRPAAATCLANRSRGVRAATARDPEEVRQVLKELNANLLVMNPAVRAAHLVLQSVRTWYKTTSPRLANELQAKLG